MLFEISTSKGLPYPLGVSFSEGGYNFALVSHSAKEISLCLFEKGKMTPIKEIGLNGAKNKTGNVWHICIYGLNESLLYAYKIMNFLGEQQFYIMDPYAKSLQTTQQWSAPQFFPLAELPALHPFDWKHDTLPRIPLENLIIYEMHVRGFTQDTSSKVKHPGTFLGIIEKIPYLKSLGVNAIELLPIQEFDENEYFRAHPSASPPFCNFWGYSTLNFFSPMKRYASESGKRAAIDEFKTLVRELHKNGIEIILDIVFNHTAEGNEHGPVYCFKSLDNSIYYLMDKDGKYLNFSGCGNTVNANHPQVQEFIIDCLRYWVAEMHVDGFRFDLASALSRGELGRPLSAAPLIEAITKDPILAQTKLIAEPWDAGGLYQVGSFFPQSLRWSEWNGKYRDAIRRFIKGSDFSHGEFATRISGSQDLYSTRLPTNSLNFITSHDGFTLADLVSYNSKHNEGNNEGNRDGANDNESWNCGVEGETTNKSILNLRERQMRNFHLALMVSQGIPMLTMGDEYGHTKKGNNNTWCHDTPLNWFLWDQLEKSDFFRFYKKLIEFRKKNSLLKRNSFLTPSDIDWHGQEPFKPDWRAPKSIVAFTLKDPNFVSDIYVAFNPKDHPTTLTIPLPRSKKWRWIVNTAWPSPSELFEEENAPLLEEQTFVMFSHSAILLKN